MVIEQLIGDIYDCAANPELWPSTLGKIRDMADCAYVMIGYLDTSELSLPYNNTWHSEWDPVWLQRLQQQIPTIPHFGRLLQQGIDTPWIQMENMSEAEFQQSDFYRNWVKPQRLRDALNTLFIDRQAVRGVMVMTQREGKPLLGDRERAIANAISPHIRRAIAINDMVDKGKLALTLYRKVLDALTVAVFIIGTGGKLVFTNAMGDKILSEGDLLRLSAGKLTSYRSDITHTAFETAIARAIKGDQSLGIAGIGVPVLGKSGQRAAAYVLPISGGDLRGDMGNGFCAVFIARRSEQLPMAIEILRTVFDLTPMEAKVAYATSRGDNPDMIAQSLGSAVETVRFHLKNAYHKTDVTDKTALAAKVNDFVPPVDPHGGRDPTSTH
ncbi:MAG: helix-turn-helix transcriptional regulator [Steroidobacteraceae bacterium]